MSLIKNRIFIFHPCPFVGLKIRTFWVRKMILNQTWNLFYESPGTTIVGWESAIYSIGNFFLWYAVPGISETRFGSSRPRLKMSQYQWQDQNRDLKGLTRPRLRLNRCESQWQDRDWNGLSLRVRTSAADDATQLLEQEGIGLVSWSAERNMIGQIEVKVNNCFAPVIRKD